MNFGLGKHFIHTYSLKKKKKNVTICYQLFIYVMFIILTIIKEYDILFRINILRGKAFNFRSMYIVLLYYSPMTLLNVS